MSSKNPTQAADALPAIEKEEQPPAPDDEYADAEKNFQPKSWKFWSIMIGVYIASFLVALDRTIIVTAIPKITDEFRSLEDVGWYGSAYMLTAACFNPVSGRVYQLYPIKWSFMLSILVFEVGSAICGAAPNSIAFILGRAVAGLGSAGIFTGGFVIMIPMVPLRKRPMFTSFFGINFALSSVLGPLIGGSFTDAVTWRWCFYINLPLGAFSLLAVLLFLNLESPKRDKLSILGHIKRLDPLGLLFLAPSMTCLILALQWAGTTSAWSDPKIIGLLVTFVVTFAIFLVVEGMFSQNAMAPFRVIFNRSVGASLAFTFVMSGAMMTIIYYVAIWFQAVRADSATQAGIHMIPLVLALVLFGIVSAGITQRIGYYVPAMILGPIVASIGAGMLSTLQPDATMGQWIGYQILYSFGLGCGMMTSSLVSQTVLSRDDVPIGLALGIFMQQLGGSIFVAVAQNIFATGLVSGLTSVSGLDAQLIVNTGATDIRRVIGPEHMEFALSVYNHSVTRTFVLAAGLSASGILFTTLLEWKSIKGRKETANEKQVDVSTK